MIAQQDQRAAAQQDQMHTGLATLADMCRVVLHAFMSAGFSRSEAATFTAMWWQDQLDRVPYPLRDEDD